MSVHMIPTKKAKDSKIEIERETGYVVLSGNTMVAFKDAAWTQAQIEKELSGKALDWLASDLATKQLDGFIEDQKND